ncbi:hypothetical protein SC851_03915 [Ligilactobacillus murinus]|nr:hypothetical protein [Ligilactobacillus murinus]WRY38407.1 hypothetical protein P8F80_03740 [Ligilactobacillus murinus]
MYEAFRKVQYTFLVNITTYSKFENTIMLCINGFFFATLPVGTIPEYILSSEMKKWLIYFYGITLVLLVVERIFWNRYYTKRWAGVAEVISNYVNIYTSYRLFRVTMDVSENMMLLSLVLIGLYYVSFVAFCTWYEYREKKERKVTKYMVYMLIVVGTPTILIAYFTDNEFFYGIGILIGAMMLSLKVIPYWLMLDTPYRRNLIKEFGPKDIDKSAIFVSKKKEKNK